MRDTFLTSLALLGAVALPVCLVISGSARPLIGFVYGTQWLSAARPLEWLALLAALRILFEPSYDYMVVLMLSRAVLVVQLVWMLFLVPALVIGIRFSGIYGASAAEAAVAAIIVLPCYLHFLRSAGVGLNALSSRLAFPALGASAVCLFATKVSWVVEGNFVALIIDGLATLVVVGVLVYRLRSAIALLRASAGFAQPHTEPIEDTSGVQERVTEYIDDRLATELAATWGVVEQSTSVREPKRNLNSSLQQALIASRRSLRDITEPIPVHKEIPGFLSGQVLDMTTPIYRITVKSRKWDPGLGEE